MQICIASKGICASAFKFNSDGSSHLNPLEAAVPMQASILKIKFRNCCVTVLDSDLSSFCKSCFTWSGFALLKWWDSTSWSVFLNHMITVEVLMLGPRLNKSGFGKTAVLTLSALNSFFCCRSSDQCWVLGYWESCCSYSSSTRWWNSPLWPGCLWKCILS